MTKGSRRADDEIIAKDSFHAWKRRVRAASRSATIFTPYLDRTAKLILDAGAHLSKDNLIVVTAWDEEMLLQTPSQLIAMKGLLRAGYGLKCLDGLHAKILFTDESLVTVGSQNFTQRGRRNKEATSLFALNITDTEFAQTLGGWLRAAEPVDEDLLDLLIQRLRPKIRQHKNLLREAAVIANDCRAEWLHAKTIREREDEAKRRRHEQERLRQLEQSSTVRLKGGEAFAELREVGEWENRHETLLVYSGSLTGWERRNAAGEWEACIDRLSNYPAYFPESARLGFARVASTRITYIRTSVDWSKTELFGGRQFRVSVSFPKDGADRANVRLVLTSAGFGAVSVRLLFKPPNVKLVKVDFEAQQGHEKALTDAFSSLSAPSTFRQLLSRYLTGFVFKKRLGSKKNLREFVGDGIYRISVVEFGAAPILVISRAN